MHELSITCSIVELVAETAKGRKVNRVTVEIGELSGVLTEFDCVLVSGSCKGDGSRKGNLGGARNLGARTLRCLRYRVSHSLHADDLSMRLIPFQTAQRRRVERQID